ncbi:MAG: hypothetical protein HQL30_13005 [Candidatus Omnitrophica bacterium]|nr:hypothetical protein [Candidatus Omnitrophota bacterium]
MPENMADRRKNYFIDREFQTRFILKFCLLIVVASVLAMTLTYLLCRQSTTVVFEDLRVVVKTTADFILPILLPVFLAVTFVASVVTIAVTMFTSHKISGPLYNLRREFAKMCRLDFSSPIHIRTSDQLQELARESEELRVAFRDSVSAQRTDILAAREELLAMKPSSENDRKVFQRVEERLEVCMKRFKTE